MRFESYILYMISMHCMQISTSIFSERSQVYMITIIVLLRGLLRSSKLTASKIVRKGKPLSLAPVSQIHLIKSEVPTTLIAYFKEEHMVSD